MTDEERTIEFYDDGPDSEDRRHFAITWPIPPRTQIERGKEVTRTRQAQHFFSNQWRKFLAEGYVVI